MHCTWFVCLLRDDLTCSWSVMCDHSWLGVERKDENKEGSPLLLKGVSSKRIGPLSRIAPFPWQVWERQEEVGQKNTASPSHGPAGIWKWQKGPHSWQSSSAAVGKLFCSTIPRHFTYTSSGKSIRIQILKRINICLKIILKRGKSAHWPWMFECIQNQYSPRNTVPEILDFLLGQQYPVEHTLAGISSCVEEW